MTPAERHALIEKARRWAPELSTLDIPQYLQDDYRLLILELADALEEADAHEPTEVDL